MSVRRRQETAGAPRRGIPGTADRFCARGRTRLSQAAAHRPAPSGRLKCWAYRRRSREGNATRPPRSSAAAYVPSRSKKSPCNIVTPPPCHRTNGPASARSGAMPFSAKKASQAIGEISTPTTSNPCAASHAMSGDFPDIGTKTLLPGMISSFGQCSASRRPRSPAVNAPPPSAQLECQNSGP